MARLSAVFDWMAAAGTKKFAFWSGVCGAVILVSTLSIHLGAPGMYYDEFRFTSAAFSAITRAFNNYAHVRFFGVPLMTMYYEGAIQVWLYLPWLFLTSGQFVLAHARLMSILVAATGVFVMSLIVGRSISRLSLILLIYLLLTDSTFLLLTRVEWAVTSVSYVLRMLLIAIWVRTAVKGSLSLWASALIGFIVGISIYDKITNVVLLPVVICLFFMSRATRGRHIAASLGGFIFGLGPLIAANMLSVFRDGNGPISFSMPVGAPVLTLERLQQVVWGYVSLGNSSLIRGSTLGYEMVMEFLQVAEGIGMAVALMLLMVAIFKHRRTGDMRMEAALLLSYAIIAVGMFILHGPYPSREYHWVVGTPFQYFALSLAVAGIAATSGTWLKTGFIAAVSVLCVVRLASLPLLVYAFNHDIINDMFHPSLTLMALQAEREMDDAFFIATDWGVAQQIFTVTEGTAGVVDEPFWQYEGPEHLRRIIEASGKRRVYLLRLPDVPVHREASDRILSDMRKLEDWVEVPISLVWNFSPVIDVWEFEKTGA